MWGIINKFFFKEIEKGVRPAYGIISNLWEFIPCVGLSVGLFSISNYNWADFYIMFKEKMVEAVRVTFSIIRYLFKEFFTINHLYLTKGRS